ncbi:hypothetical protein ONZ45_g1493 [Pleurotus djamor]|nr:hypothetical protein ONZ45_g1493 [Pleurotus djamor]
MPTTALLLFLAFLVLVVSYTRPRSKLSLPPGPRKLPIVGNLLEMSKERQWVQLAEMSRTFNTDILFLKALRTPIIVLSSVESVSELLIRRSALTSSRPVSRMLVELMGWGFNAAFLPYGEKWRARRRAFWQEFHPERLHTYYSTQERHARRFLRRLLVDPDNLFHHIQYTPASMIIQAAYGIDVAFENDAIISQGSKTLVHLRIAGTIGTFSVDYIPMLKYVPKWFPLAKFQMLAEESRSDVGRMCDGPFKKAKETMGRGSVAPSVVSRSLTGARQRGLVEDETESIIKDVAAVSYVGSAETTPSSLINFFAAMVLYPSVQKKAQDEIDNIVGLLRLPTCEDLGSLVYTKAVMWEVLRWKPITPMGIAHLLTADDTYKGYHLPKGSHIFCNVWQIMQDSKVFPDPFTFRPERFIKDGQIDVDLTNIVQMNFGFGRRICPGRFMAMDTFQIWMSSTLAVFNIIPALDSEGRSILPETELLPGFVT